MAELTFISETGMFHSACRCIWNDGGEDWYGFKPRKHLSPAGRGFVDRSDRAKFVNHARTFQVPTARLRVAIDKVAARYADRTYILTVCDCVSFTADVAREAGLLVPALNFTPYGFVVVLGWWNHHE